MGIQVYDLKDMVKGWFVGDFSPSVLRTDQVEVAVKTYKAGDAESAHYHKVAKEITVVASGWVRMNGSEYGPGSIIMINQNQVTDFFAITDVITTVVKYPGASADKYMLAESANDVE